MANRMYNQFQGTLEKGVVQLFAEVSFGAAGAPTLVRGKGVASIAKASTGTFTVTLQDTYLRTLGLSTAWKGTAAPAGDNVVLNTDNCTGATGGIPTVTLKVYSTAGSAIDPASGEAVLVALTLSNSTAI